MTVCVVYVAGFLATWTPLSYMPVTSYFGQESMAKLGDNWRSEIQEPGTVDLRL